MVEGRLRKFYEEFVLLEQIFVVDQESKVRKVVEHAAKAAGAPIKLVGFARFALGEGIDKATHRLCRRGRGTAEELTAKAGRLPSPRRCAERGQTAGRLVRSGLV